MTAGQTNLLKSWEEHESNLGSGTVISFMASGEGHMTAIVNAVVDRYNAILDRPRPTQEELELLVGEKVTLVQAGETMLGARLLIAQEGKLFTSSRGGYGILPKGARSKGFKVREDELLDVLPGYDTAGAEAYVRMVRQHFPTLGPLTLERLKELPTNSEELRMCAFGSYRMPDSTATDALYLFSEYWPEEDIVEGVLLIRPEHGFSEHGSAYGRQFYGGHFGEVLGFEPISFAEGIHLCNLDFEEAYEQVIGKKVTA